MSLFGNIFLVVKGLSFSNLVHKYKSKWWTYQNIFFKYFFYLLFYQFLFHIKDLLGFAYFNFSLKSSTNWKLGVLKQPTVQEQGHMALPVKQGHIGPEVNDSHYNNPPAPEDKDNTKPMWRTWQDSISRNQF